MWKMPPAANFEVFPRTCPPRNVGDESCDHTPPPAPLLAMPAPPVPEALLAMSHAVNTGRDPDTM